MERRKTGNQDEHLSTLTGSWQVDGYLRVCKLAFCFLRKNKVKSQFLTAWAACLKHWIQKPGRYEAYMYQTSPSNGIHDTWRIIQISKWLGSPMYCSHLYPFIDRPFGRGRKKNSILRELTVSKMVINHVS